jgi:hypothetical protein
VAEELSSIGGKLKKEWKFAIILGVEIKEWHQKWAATKEHF